VRSRAVGCEARRLVSAPRRLVGSGWLLYSAAVQQTATWVADLRITSPQGPVVCVVLVLVELPWIFTAVRRRPSSWLLGWLLDESSVAGEPSR
jgi:hypothetical protein